MCLFFTWFQLVLVDMGNCHTLSDVNTQYDYVKQFSGSFILSLGEYWEMHWAPLDKHTHARTQVMHCPGSATRWSLFSCFFANEQDLYFIAWKCQRHLSKLCWANGRMCICNIRLFWIIGYSDTNSQPWHERRLPFSLHLSVNCM